MNCGLVFLSIVRFGRQRPEVTSDFQGSAFWGGLPPQNLEKIIHISTHCRKLRLNKPITID